MTLVHLVADYGQGDLAFAEVTQRLAQELSDPTVVAVPVAPFDTLAAGFCIAQLSLTEGPNDRVVFHNVAPREDHRDARRANEGERFTVVELDGGVRVVGPNSGWSLSFLTEAGASARYLAAPSAGSQFRSRDFVPQAIGRLVAGDADVIGEPVPGDGVPPVPDGSLAYADGYGNLKTTWQAAPVATGERVLVRIGDASSTAVVSDGTFEVADGELSFAPGSSGWTSLDGSLRPLYELLLRGGSAAARMGHPASGASVDLWPV